MADPEKTRDALNLIMSVVNGLRDGVKYHSKAGVPLTTVHGVLEALIEDGEVTLVEPEVPR